VLICDWWWRKEGVDFRDSGLDDACSYESDCLHSLKAMLLEACASCGAGGLHFLPAREGAASSAPTTASSQF
jgi:hypothetical protein